MKTNTPDPGEGEIALAAHILNLQCRIDALTAAVRVLAAAQGSPHDQFYGALEKVFAASYQKRLEHIERQDPRLAALLDTRKDASGIDQSLLDGLRFDDEDKKP